MKKYKLNKRGVILYLAIYLIIIALLDVFAKYSITHNSNLTDIHILTLNTITLFSKLFAIEVYKMLKNYRFN